MQSVSTFFKEENDYLYRRGERIGESRGESRGERIGEIRGAEKMVHAFIKNLIVKLDLTDEQLVEIAEVSAEYVQKVRAELQDQ